MHSDITSVLTGQPLGIWVGQELSTAQFGSPVQSLEATATRRAGRVMQLAAANQTVILNSRTLEIVLGMVSDTNSRSRNLSEIVAGIPSEPRAL